ncbi:modulator of FtsH protease [Lebetimonas natsushimae]|uniref:Modulator of FtsH protease n=1 Tax=Lebetimonas natsushimae TaxID=1936991 RepID=A0A292YBM9_9BACT|nr:Bax inhibitor-1/YccA family protein [Lebetimonas natsushimae]GAX88372.1 modulator of FtsH protease [Lebetimonas natsushimae]
MKFSSNDFKNSYVNKTYTNEAYNSHSIENINVFVKKTYQLLAGSLIAGAVGAYVGMGFVSNMINPVTGGLTFTYWGAVILEFILLFGLFAAKDKTPLNLVLLFAFTFMTGFTLAPTLAVFVARNMGYVIGEAFGLTAVAFGALTIFAMNTKKDFTTMGKMLFITLIVLIVASIANIFLHLPMLQLIIASVGAVLFSMFILFDTQNIIRGNVSSEIEAAVALYLDFLNLFISLLQILGFLNNEE